MNTSSAGCAATFPLHAEFYYYRTDNLLRVENGDKGVIVRAMRDNFSDLEKETFVRQLALEGFIPQRYQWSPEDRVRTGDVVNWVIDDSWTLRLSAHRMISRFGRPFIATGGMLLLMGLVGYFGFRVADRTTAAFHQTFQILG